LDIGERIKTLREDAGLTQEELGERLGIQKAAVHKYEKGTVKNIKRKTILELARIFDTSPTYIMGFDDISDPRLKVPVNIKSARIPVYRAIAPKESADNDKNIIAYEDIPYAWLENGDDYIALKVPDDSMEPKFLKNDTIIVKKQKKCASGQLCVCHVGNIRIIIRKMIRENDIPKFHVCFLLASKITISRRI